MNQTSMWVNGFDAPTAGLISGVVTLILFWKLFRGAKSAVSVLIILVIAALFWLLAFHVADSPQGAFNKVTGWKNSAEDVKPKVPGLQNPVKK